jgi:hypothetical protein
MAIDSSRYLNFQSRTMGDLKRGKKMWPRNQYKGIGGGRYKGIGGGLYKGIGGGATGFRGHPIKAAGRVVATSTQHETPNALIPLMVFRTSNPRVGSSNLSERASKIKGLSGFFAYRFCPWETVGKLAQGAALPVLAIHKKSSAVDKGVTGLYARASGSPAFIASILAQIVDKICSAGNRRP